MNDPAAKIPTPEEVQDRLNKQHGAIVPLKASLPAVADKQTAIAAFINEIAPASIVGRMIKFTKDGIFATHDDGEAVGDNVDFTAIIDQTLVGVIKFNGEGALPDRRMGLLYGDPPFIPPKQDDLPDRDQAAWELGLDGKPQDPWQQHVYLVLQRADTGELFTYVTSSITGRRAVGNLLQHFGRMRRTHPGHYPVIRLKTGGFNHRDDRVGWVKTPALTVVGRAPMDSAARPNTAPSGDMDDAIPF
jgi:hypothetical protein